MITKIKLENIPGRKCSRNETAAREVMDFWQSDWPAAEVDIAKYRDAHSAYGVYRVAAEKAKVGVRAVTRENRLFLLRTE